MKRFAVLVGCNYAHTRNELHGCINDVLAMKEVLIKRFGFDHTNIELLTDAAGSPVMPTGANIKKALEKMAGQAKDGDVLFFHYSGHGTRIPKPGHPSKQDEAIVPCDFNLITDVDFRHIVNRVPKGASFIIFSDSCHSGGLIDKEKEQIGPHSTTNTSTINSHIRPKTIPYESVLQHLSSQTSINTSDISTHLLESFGGDASLKFRSAKYELDSFPPLKPDEGILLSGCQENETSADMSPTEQGGKAYGAFSNAVQLVLKEHSGPLTNKQVVMMARKLLKEQGFEQHPCLYCSDENAEATFLHQQPENKTKQ
ncbi:latex-abundant family protein [Tripterygium wilfordii]|uniref:Latex-abundant family protein n=1 Tax=Tripterygium wilfordii TaxID=458696 RepID=A0A7J7CU85_TRIWF|nr:metacaspase-9 [Tripterygium wilfordii]KAF5737594.1 latex-abundant family protein [Tripterygium wilfordii]